MKIKATVDGLELELTIPDETFRTEKYPEGELSGEYQREIEDFKIRATRLLEILLAKSVLPESVSTKRRIEAKLVDAQEHAKSLESARRLAYLGT